MERAIEVFFVLNFAAIGLSHLVQPRAWVEFFQILRGRGHAGVLMNGMLSLLVGTLIVSFHNVWTGAGAIVTVVGWAQVAKGVVSVTAPAAGLRGLMRVSNERAHEIRIAGAVFVVLSAVIASTWIDAWPRP